MWIFHSFIDLSSCLGLFETCVFPSWLGPSEPLYSSPAAMPLRGGGRCILISYPTAWAPAHFNFASSVQLAVSEYSESPKKRISEWFHTLWRPLGCVSLFPYQILSCSGLGQELISVLIPGIMKVMQDGSSVPSAFWGSSSPSLVSRVLWHLHHFVSLKANGNSGFSSWFF